MYLSNKAKKVLYADETWHLRAEYKKLTGKSFPLFNYDYWRSIDEWLAELKRGIEDANNKQTPQRSDKKEA